MAERKMGTLTKREHEVLALVTRGKQNKEIARKLHISEATVENHLNNIFRKWDVNNRTEATYHFFQSE